MLPQIASSCRASYFQRAACSSSLARALWVLVRLLGVLFVRSGAVVTTNDTDHFTCLLIVVYLEICT